MMQVSTTAEQLFFTTVNLLGHRNGKVSYGTGFIYGVETDKGTAHFLVTNKHVLEQSTDQLVVRMLKASQGAPAYGRGAAEVAYSGFAEGWHLHPKRDVDVCVLPFGRVLSHLAAVGTPPFFRSIPSQLAMRRGHAATELDALEDVTFFGYPNDLYDEHNLTTIARQDTTASPIALGYCGLPGFLIRCLGISWI